MSESITFANPILRGFNPDPTVCVVPATDTAPATFFLSTSTFEFYPGCAIYTSTNLVDWKLIGHALTRRSQMELRTPEPGAGSWASTLRYRPGEKRWYLANGLFQRYRPAVDERIFPRGFYVWTDNIWDDRAWSDPVFFDNPGFDQDLFWDDDGKVYLSTTMRLAWRSPESNKKDFAIHISEIDIKTGNTLTAPRAIRESPHGIAEGSHILKRGAYYYLFTAEGGTEAGHQEWVLRSRDGPYGPWEGQGKPLWYNGPAEEVQRTGHADVFEDGEGQWWAVLLGVRPANKADGSFLEPQLGRESFLVKVDWVDDWPVFNDGKNITLQTAGRPSMKLTGSQNALQKWQADFSKETLELGWYQKNTPIKQCYSLSARPGHLRLYGNCFDLSSPEGPAMLLRKQTSYHQSFGAKMQFKPTVGGYEAGAVLWWSQYSYAAVCLVAAEDSAGRITVTPVIKRPSGQAGSIEACWMAFCLLFLYLLAYCSLYYGPQLVSAANNTRVHQTETIKSIAVGDSVGFRIRAHPTSYELSILGTGDPYSFSVEAETLTIAPPVGGCFTGTMFGVYSCGTNQPVLDPAEFWDIKMEEH